MEKLRWCSTIAAWSLWRASCMRDMHPCACASAHPVRNGQELRIKAGIHGFCSVSFHFTCFEPRCVSTVGHRFLRRIATRSASSSQNTKSWSNFSWMAWTFSSHSGCSEVFHFVLVSRRAIAIGQSVKHWKSIRYTRLDLAMKSRKCHSLHSLCVPSEDRFVYCCLITCKLLSHIKR